ncbi:MAG TPA: iron ABC transporter permease [Dehalococcoidia bacterium]|nr:iron ABC transporter permease [Dehalococcoidia bacterium]
MRAADAGPLAGAQQPAAADAVEMPLLTLRRVLPSYAIGIVTTLAVALFAICWGTVHIPPQTTIAILLGHLPFVSTGTHDPTYDAIVWDVRVPRVVLAGLVGATLGYAGATYQGVFRNPLAEPYLIGVAAGASVGATLIIISPLYVAAGLLSPVPPAAFCGALIAVALAYGLARAGRAVPVTGLILSGVAISSIGTSVVTYLMLTYTDRTISILNWTLGGFNTASWTKSAIALPYMVVALVLILPFARLLNVMQLDDDDARQLGVDVERVKLLLLGLASLATAAAVAVSGLIGFVGLIVPHTARMIFGPDYRRVLPMSAFFGASFLILADTLARSLDGGREIPIGVVTALIGAPFFLHLLRRYQRAAGELRDA